MKKTNIRLPSVAGQFYSASKQGLNKQIQALLNSGAVAKEKAAGSASVIACMLPHAGYMYSGAVAAQTVSCLNIKDKIILLGPNHTGYGAPFSIMAEGTWLTPLGEVNIDAILAKKILSHSKYLKEDSLAHLYEHSLEVELPLLQYFRPDFEITPIVIQANDLTALKEIGKDIASGVKESNLQNSALIVASSDMTHYEPQEEAERKDKEAIGAILALDEDRLWEKVKKLGISMCGYAPAIVMIVAAKLLGATKANLVKYETSGDVTGDKTSVVGYAGILVY
jgi:AmmeMemoRadiSam system protein B